MANKEEFKNFVRKNPKLLGYVKKGEMTWQKFYELFDLYGEENDVWAPYLATVSTTSVASTNSILDSFSWLKNLDLDSIQEGINSLQRVVGVVGDLTNKNTSKETPVKDEYKPRPLYKHFED